MERWDSSVSRWQRGHLVLTRAGFLHFFAPDSAAAKAAVAAGIGGGGGGAGVRGGGGLAASRNSSVGQLSWGGASSWTPPIESLNLSRCSFEQGNCCRMQGCGSWTAAWCACACNYSPPALVRCRVHRA